MTQSFDIESVVQSGSRVMDAESFKNWIRSSIRPLLPHEALVCANGRIHAAGITIDYLICVDFPQSHLEDVCNSAGGIETPLLRRWLQEQQPLLFEPAVHHHWPEISTEWLRRFKQNDLRNAAAHAVYDVKGCVGSYFSFHRLPHSPGEQEKQALLALTPVLHETLMRVVQNLEQEELRRRPNWFCLSSRELEMVQAIARGRNNQEISEFMGLSENTIKHHVSSILKKTQLHNRAQLAAALAKYPPNELAKGTLML